MKVAVCGMGKLGWPVALAEAVKHDVVGYDISLSAKEILRTRKYPHREAGAQELLDATTLRIADTVEDAVRHADIIFVAVQTPHAPEYEGVTRAPTQRADFDYSHLRACIAEIAGTAKRLKKHVVLIVISTCIPGTSRRELYPILEDNPYVAYIYNPYFIAMGSVIADHLKPEFVLVGMDPERCWPGVENLVREFYGTLHNQYLQFMSVESAELTKVAYNVFIGLKILAANAIMEIAHKIPGTNCDDVATALKSATDRVVSPKYLNGGGADSGPCHPRDAIALSWLAEKLNLSFDLFGTMVEGRERQTEWIAKLAIDEARKRALNIVILGKAYKRGTNLVIGSWSTLLANIVQEHAWAKNHRVEMWDPHVDGPREFGTPAVFVVATDHDEFYRMGFPHGSAVLDPWGKMAERAGCEVVLVGRAR